MIDRLTVSLDFGPEAVSRNVGQMGREPTRRGFAFEWSPEFAATPLPIWPVKAKQPFGLLRSSGNRPRSVPGLFEDSLPDGWGRLLLDREIRARNGDGSDLDDMERLAFVGRHGMGALSYAPETTPQDTKAIDIGWFEDVVPRVEDGASVADLQRLRVISGGSQGARPKFVAQIDENRHALRDHRTPWETGWTHVLIKGRGSMDPRGSIEAELAYGKLLRAAGIETSNMFALEGTEETFFATERFDRKGEARSHMATVAGLLDTDLQHGVFDYVELMRLTKAICREKERSAEEIFRRLVFNARAISRDDHIRNHAFLMDAEGNWRLAPAFDVTFDLGPGGEHSMAIAGEGRSPGLKSFAKVASVGGIKPKRRDAIIEEIDTALRKWNEVAKDYCVPKAMRESIGKEMEAARSWP